jgi:hypothetical protein
MSNDCNHVCRLVIAWMCKGYCPNYRECQLITKEINYQQMCICLDNGIMFNTGHYPKVNEIKKQVIKGKEKI